MIECNDHKSATTEEPKPIIEKLAKEDVDLAYGLTRHDGMHPKTVLRQSVPPQPGSSPHSRCQGQHHPKETGHSQPLLPRQRKRAINQ
mmetsp:Transcript_34920/g.104164  ORF Transcript_34920/g.104164 Transcript_34920/m.104164 type:complete len:88 (+) Transcript_34920:360-623(+)